MIMQGYVQVNILPYSGDIHTCMKNEKAVTLFTFVRR